MKDHIVLCGLGKVGFSMLETLHVLNEPVIVVTRGIDDEWSNRASSLAESILYDDARSESALRAAGIPGARSLIIATNDDLANLEIALDARRLCPAINIVLRLHDPELAKRVKSELNVQYVLNAAELAAPAIVAAALGENVIRAFDVENRSVNILRVAVKDKATGLGETLHEMSTRLNVIPIAVRSEDSDHRLAPSLENQLQAGDEVVVVASESSVHQLEGHEHAIRPGAVGSSRIRDRHTWVRPKVGLLKLIRSVWANASLLARNVALSVLLLALVAIFVFKFALNLSWLDAAYFTTTMLTTVGFGDFHLRDASPGVKVFGIIILLSGASLMVGFYSIMTDYLLSQRVATLLGRPRTSLKKHIIVVGLGNFGHRVVERLHELGEPVLAIDRTEDREIGTVLPADIPILVGDAAQIQTLEQAGIGHARSIVTLTSDDLGNLRIAQIAERVQPGLRTVVRMFNASLAAKIGASTLGVSQIVHPSDASAATFVAAALAENVLQGFMLHGKMIVMRSIRAESLRGVVGKQVGALREAGVLVLLRQSAGARALTDARSEEVIRTGDRLVVLEEYRPDLRQTASCTLTELEEIDETVLA